MNVLVMDGGQWRLVLEKNRIISVFRSASDTLDLWIAREICLAGCSLHGMEYIQTPSPVFSCFFHIKRIYLHMSVLEAQRISLKSSLLRYISLRGMSDDRSGSPPSRISLRIWCGAGGPSRVGKGEGGSTLHGETSTRHLLELGSNRLVDLKKL